VTIIEGRFVRTDYDDPSADEFHILRKAEHRDCRRPWRRRLQGDTTVLTTRRPMLDSIDP
jgi:hypothetical protein